MSGFLPLLLVVGLAMMGGVALWLYQRAAVRKRIAARLLPHTISPRDAALPIWLRAGVAEEVLGIKVEEESLPSGLSWLGSNARRAGLRLSTFDVLLLSALLGLFTGGIVLLRWRHENFASLTMVFFMVVPNLAILIYGNMRVRRMEEQLADMLDATVGALRAGIGLRQALEVVRGSRRPPIAAVLNAVLAMTDLGLPLAEAFRQTTRHLRSKHFNMLLIALDANADAGSALSPMLAGMAARIRDSIRMRRRISALTAEARFSIIVMFIILYIVGYMIWTFRPDTLLYLFYHPLGYTLLQIAFVCQVIGILWMMYLVRSRD